MTLLADPQTPPDDHQDRSTGPLVLDLTGMTCASCVGRVEKALTKVDGVASADVNLATERATVVASPTVDVRQLTAAVEAAGYGATPVEAPQRPGPLSHSRGPPALPRPIPTPMDVPGVGWPSSGSSDASGRSAWSPGSR